MDDELFADFDNLWASADEDACPDSSRGTALLAWKAAIAVVRAHDRDGERCNYCATSLVCISGRSAHPSNWYCPVCELKTELAVLREDAAIGRLVRRKLVSGNGVPVERCHITANEVAAIDAAMRAEG